MAALWKLPVIFFCENNGYGVSTAIEKVSCTEHIAQRAEGFGIPAKIVDGNDPIEVYDAIARMKKRLLESGVSQEEIDKLDQAITEEIEEAYTFAVESEYPDASEVLTDGYAVDNEKGVAR